MKKGIVKPGSTIGILGGGQLGRMMAIAAKEMGYRIAVLEPAPDSPCAQVADIEIIGRYDDREAAQKLAKASDVITYEFENVDVENVKWLEETAFIPQGHKLLEVTQDRVNEKTTIINAGLQTAPYRIASTLEELTTAVDQIGFPSVLKTTRGGYDGKGQLVFRKAEDIDANAIAPMLAQGRCILEGWVPFEKEISVIVSRSVSGETKTFPVAENIHVNNILAETIVPARVTDFVKAEAEHAAMRLAEALEMVGTLAVEMFVTADEQIFINEMAPRPHNSGHYTIDACETSQFQQHIRAICDLPLGPTELLKPVVMVNILGEHLEPILSELDEFDNVKLHLYGKKEAKRKRKMGHFNVLDADLTRAIEKAENLMAKMNAEDVVSK